LPLIPIIDFRGSRLNATNSSEADLDVQYMLGIAFSRNITYWASQNGFWQWVVEVSQDARPPLVHSISYGSNNDNPSTSRARFNTEACKLGLRGVTIVVSSGDDGAPGGTVRNSTEHPNPAPCGIHTQFPAESPYVTTVGATMGPENGGPEIVCDFRTGGGITSGGGFSKQFLQPWYQNTSVPAYLNTATGLPSKDHFASNGRGYPDVALLGHRYSIFHNGRPAGESGTSASTPVFAAMLTLVNEARLQSNKPALGFVNPALYKAPASVWNDITVGNNNCAIGNCCPEGFSAATGWDAVTGLGSPRFQALSTYLKNL